MADPIWLSRSSTAIEATFAQLDRLLQPVQSQRASNLADLRQQVARLDGSDQPDEPYESPPPRRERPDESHRGKAAENDRPFTAIPQGDWGPVVREKLTREALAKERRW